jgi:hypothetical protein
MKTVVVFREGYSGHFLRAVILNHPSTVANFRIDDRLLSHNKELYVQLTHDTHAISNTDRIFRILPTRKIYNPIYNNFMKKILVEEFPNFDLANWINDPVFWYDKCYYHIQEYYSKIHNDISTNTIQHVIDFDQLTDTEYLSNMLQQEFQLELDANRRALVKNYAELQLKIDLIDDTTLLMQDILSPITDSMLLQNPWFWAYAVFKFEHNNNLTENRRLWSINNFKVPQTRSEIIQYQYRLECNTPRIV